MTNDLKFFTIFTPMHSIRITTSQNIDLEYELGSVGDRIIACLLDWLIIVAYVIITFAVMSFGSLASFIRENVWLVIVLLLPIVFYDLLSEMWLNGQSVGKKVMGIKVISLTGEPPAFSQYLIRWLFRLVDFSSFLGLVALATVAATEKHQRLGDIVAGTVLVKTKPRTGFSDTLYHPPAPAQYNATYPEVINLSDRDIQLIKEVIVSVRRSGQAALASEAQSKIEKVLRIKSYHPDPMAFLQAVLIDYNHLASQL